MCKFFSVVSDGEGKVSFFKPEDVVSIMAKGNPDGLDFNSHTSLMSWLGIKGKKEDVMNKWEYNPEDKKLTVDNLGTESDKKLVQFELDEFFKEKDIVFLRNLYGRNAGYSNAGSRNAGSYNVGSRNAGYSNVGSDNAGSYNAGYSNVGSDNAGSYNVGSRNAGYSNVGSDNAGSFCTTSDLRLFDKPCTLKEHEAVKKLDWSWFSVVEWIKFKDMTKVEKETFPDISKIVCGGYFKPRSVNEAWEKCPKSFLKEVQKLKNFDAEIFKEITGLSV